MQRKNKLFSLFEGGGVRDKGGRGKRGKEKGENLFPKTKNNIAKRNEK